MSNTKIANGKTPKRACRDGKHRKENVEGMQQNIYRCPRDIYDYPFDMNSYQNVFFRDLSEFRISSHTFENKSSIVSEEESLVRVRENAVGKDKNEGVMKYIDTTDKSQ